MEGPQRQSLNINGEEAKGDEFYEQIEAPKFVDLAAPEPYHPGDDRYWFCLRVGCDQNHGEEMDSEAIYKNFVLRVMAARSPNVRLRKALYRKESSANVKCPQSVPAKSSKSRVARLALISSISKKMVDPKVKVKPLSKTPNAKIKQHPVANALTTPGNKKQKPNLDAFQSARNPKATPVAVPKNRTVAKTLVFHSPKKVVKASVAPQLNTPVKTLRAGMKKLEITSGKKPVLGYNRPVPTDPSRKQLKEREVKSRVYDGLHSQSCKGQESASSKCLKTATVARDLDKHHFTVPSEGVENDFSNKEIEENPRNGSLEVCCSSTSNDRNVNAGSLTTIEVLKPLDENKVEAFSGTSKSDLNLEPNSGERISGDADAPNFEASCMTGNNTDGNKGEQKSTLKMGINDKTKKHTMRSCNNANRSKIMERGDKENTKENTLASDANRQLDLSTGHTENEFIVKRTSKAPQKIVTAMNYPSKEISTIAATGARKQKNRKPKATNPKPFRLRTDERIIYKDKIMEKNPRLMPLKEIKSFSRISQKRNETLIQSDKKCLKESQYDNDTSDVNGKETNSTQMDHQPQNGTPNLKFSKERAGQKLSEISQKHTVSSQQKLVTRRLEYNPDERTQKLGNSLKRTKATCVRQHASLQKAASSTKEIDSTTTPHQVGVIKETLPIILRPNEEGTLRVDGTSLISKTPTSATSRKSLLGKRLTAISKEPNFHNVHVPKSCTRKIT